MPATILIIDAGARGHAISCAYETSRNVGRIVVAPGNDFISSNRTKEVLVEKACAVHDPASILEVAKKYNPDIIDVAQDNALALGTTDLLRKNGFRVFGPTQLASRIESDKKWSKEFMIRHGIPTARFAHFSSENEAIDYVSTIYTRSPNTYIFIKAAGLCGGKGALMANSIEDAVSCIYAMKSFGSAGKTFLIEEGLQGEEFSCYAISDGNSYRIFKSAQDHKKSHDHDTGDQTGGMGAISPAQVTDHFASQIEETMIAPALRGMKSEQVPFEGILYLGGIIADGKPYVIEYNARWGDPECQVVLPSVTTDYFELVNAVIEKRLHEVRLEQDNKRRLCIVGSLRGYPHEFSSARGSRIFGLDAAINIEHVRLFGAGIICNNGQFLADGGRVLNVVGEGATIVEARSRAYSAISQIFIEGNKMHYRTDIGWNDLERFYAI